ncbi:MAG: ExbD/TolR family protein [Alphaproteobacteria bacterium]
MSTFISGPPVLRLAPRPARRRSPINLTPLIDVVFILLVFFMLTTSFLDWRVIALDPPGRAAAAAGMEGALLVEVRDDGLRLAGVAISPEALGDVLRARLAAQPDRRVLVKPAPGVSLQVAVGVLDRVTAAGGRNVALLRDGGR